MFVFWAVAKLLRSSQNYLWTIRNVVQLLYTISFQALSAGTEGKESRPPNYIVLMTTLLLALHCTVLLSCAALLSRIITK